MSVNDRKYRDIRCMMDCARFGWGLKLTPPGPEQDSVTRCQPCFGNCLQCWPSSLRSSATVLKRISWDFIRSWNTIYKRNRYQLWWRIDNCLSLLLFLELQERVACDLPHLLEKLHPLTNRLEDDWDCNGFPSMIWSQSCAELARD